MRWKGPLSKALRDESRYLCLEGAIRSGKTSCALWKVFNHVMTQPGAKWLLARWSDDAAHSLLRPLWEDVLMKAGVPIDWQSMQSYYAMPNGSRVFVHGLRPSESVNPYTKLRGMTLAGIYVDQAEELPHDFFPELQGRLSQQGYPQQLILTPNAVPEDHWIAKSEFPEDNRRPGYTYIRVSVYDNAHNLDANYLAGLEAAYPPGHPKRRTMIEGLRGLNVVGQPVYGTDGKHQGAFDRHRHLADLSLNPHTPLLEAIDFGKHHPCVLWAQFTPYGGLDLLGGVMGQDMGLSEFANLILRYRAFWFPDPLEVQSCCDPAGTNDNSHGTQTGADVLATRGIVCRTVKSANSPAVRLGCIEAIKDLMSRRIGQVEAFRCHPSRWLIIEAAEVQQRPFVPDALEAGYVWDPHPRSVSNKPMHVPLKDGWYEHGMNCLEYIEANFGTAHPSLKDVEREQDKAYARALKRAQRDADPYDWQVRRAPIGRGGYA